MTILEHILIAARKCLDSTKLVSGIRPIVCENISVYEECIDASLSQQFELLSGLMFEYARFCQNEKREAGEIGEEPLSRADAVRLMNNFVDLARNDVNNALNNSTPLSSATEIGVRAQTFAAVLCSGATESRS